MNIRCLICVFTCFIERDPALSRAAIIISCRLFWQPWLCDAVPPPRIHQICSFSMLPTFHLNFSTIILSLCYFYEKYLRRKSSATRLHYAWQLLQKQYNFCPLHWCSAPKLSRNLIPPSSSLLFNLVIELSRENEQSSLK